MDISPLRRLKKLTFLDISETGVSDLSPLKDVESLDTLWIGGIPARDLSPLYECERLKVIDLTVLDLSDPGDPPLRPVWTLEQVSELRSRLPTVEIKYP